MYRQALALRALLLFANLIKREVTIKECDGRMRLHFFTGGLWSFQEEENFVIVRELQSLCPGVQCLIYWQ